MGLNHQKQVNELKMAGKKGRSGKNGKGKTQPKRSDIQRKLDRAEMMKLLRRGWSKTQIAEKLGVHQTMISYDYKLVMKEVIANQTKDALFLRAKALEELAEVKKEAWIGWDKSKELHRKKVIEEYDKGDDSPMSTKTVDTTEGSLPGSHYLNIILNCIAKEAELTGINADKVLQVQQTVINWDKLYETPANAMDDIERKIKEVEALPDPNSPIIEAEYEVVDQSAEGEEEVEH